MWWRHEFRRRKCMRPLSADAQMRLQILAVQTRSLFADDWNAPECRCRTVGLDPRLHDDKRLATEPVCGRASRHRPTSRCDLGRGSFSCSRRRGCRASGRRWLCGAAARVLVLAAPHQFEASTSALPTLGQPSRSSPSSRVARSGLLTSQHVAGVEFIRFDPHDGDAVFGCGCSCES